MNDQEMLKKIKEEMDKIPVPDTVSPEAMCEKLKKEPKPARRRRVPAWGSVAAAAAFLVVCGIAAGQNGGFPWVIPPTEEVQQGTAAAADKNEQHEQMAVVHLSAGDLYHSAESYEDVRKELKEIYKEQYTNQERGGGFNFLAKDEILIEDSASISEGDMEAAAEGTGSSGFSGTNLQTLGVDESDWYKTDGDTIYMVSGSVIRMVDIRDEKMKPLADLTLPADDASDETQILELYVDGDTLSIITSVYEASIESSENQEITEKSFVGDCYYMRRSSETVVYTYDISDPEKPELQGTFCQEGNYYTSRKVDSMLYLFTQKDMMESQDVWNTKADAEDWIPRAGGEIISCEDIYLPDDRGSQGLIIASVDLNQPDVAKDSIMILNNYPEIYVGSSNIYLYEGNWNGNREMTDIASFSMKDGIIGAKAAASVPGVITDTFAIQEAGGHLRVLTTEWSDETQLNHLTILDEELKVLGKLRDLAPGETIYSARYLGDTAYFVTYRNMDPLFAVDLSDETDPQILAELKITGYSEYLHFWGEDQLLGFGYETDPESGENLGLKLSMFDVTDSSELKVIDSKIMKEIWYSQALYDYKRILVDQKENLIGFVTENSSDSEENVWGQYRIYSFQNGKFELIKKIPLKGEVYYQNADGMYSGDRFYLVEENQIRSFDRTKDFEALDTVIFK